jgi:hypothetical protein
MTWYTVVRLTRAKGHGTKSTYSKLLIFCRIVTVYVVQQATTTRQPLDHGAARVKRDGNSQQGRLSDLSLPVASRPRSACSYLLTGQDMSFRPHKQDKDKLIQDGLSSILGSTDPS